MSAAEHESLLDELRAALGPAVITDEVSLRTLATDYSGHDSGTLPIALLEPTSREQVQAAMQIAHAHRIPVVPRGAGTGLAGGAIGSRGELVLSLMRMNRILEVSVADELAVVEPGIINDELNIELAKQRLWWAPDPASKALSTVGGNIATNAGGLLCAKYGVTREAVLGLVVVLADGTMLRLGHRSVKGVTGLDLTALMIGSEGTLGVIVEATLKLRPVQSTEVSTIGAYFPSVVAAAAASASITAAGFRPSAMELLDAPAVTGIAEYLGLTTRGDAWLLVQFDGPSHASDAAAAITLVHTAGGDAEVTTGAEAGEKLFAIRRAFHPAMAARGTVLIEDVAVPRSALPDMFAAIAAIATRYGMVIPTVAHAGDGNLHPNFVYQPGPSGDVPEQVWDAAGELFTAALALGGTLTGEHGVGLLKKRWLEQELGTAQVELQRRIKHAFDTEGILNPGKVF